MNARHCLRLALFIGGGCASLGTLACGGDTGKTGGGPTGGAGGSPTTSTTTATTTTTGPGSGSGAGGATTGGSGGTGTTTGTGGSVSMVDCTKDTGLTRDVLADFESGSGHVNDAPGRNGSFYTYNDKTAAGAQEPPAGDAAPAEIPGGRCASKFAMHVSAKGFMVWGAGFGVDFAYGVAPDGGAIVPDSGVNPRGSYDASAYAGISFWARVEPGSKPGLRLGVADKTTAPEGGKCIVDDTGMNPNRCYDDFGKTVGITSSWDFFKVSFAEMTQRGFGLKAPSIDKAHVFGLQFQAGAAVDYDVWVDDLAFYK